MNTFLFTQITNTILGVLIVAGLVLLIYKKFKATGVISIVLAFLVFLIGIITSISIVICTIIAITMGVLESQNAAIVSRIIKNTLNAGKIKLADENSSQKNRKYVPYWA